MNHRQQARDLIELAADSRTPEKERLSAAIKAVALIRKYDLLANPLDSLVDNETVQAGKSIFDMLTNPESELVRNVKKISKGVKKLRRR